MWSLLHIIIRFWGKSYIKYWNYDLTFAFLRQVTFGGGFVGADTRHAGEYQTSECSWSSPASHKKPSLSEEEKHDFLHPCQGQQDGERSHTTLARPVIAQSSKDVLASILTDAKNDMADEAGAAAENDPAGWILLQRRKNPTERPPTCKGRTNRRPVQWTPRVSRRNEAPKSPRPEGEDSSAEVQKRDESRLEGWKHDAVQKQEAKDPPCTGHVGDEASVGVHFQCSSDDVGSKNFKKCNLVLKKY